MPRDIPIGNGSVLVTFDHTYQLRDLYYPHIGKENQSLGNPFRLGVWVDGQFSWVSETAWVKRLTYLPETLVSHVTAHHATHRVRLVCLDAVDFHEPIYLKRITVENQAAQAREIRLFFGQDFYIYGTDVGDTAEYDPLLQSILHYKGKRYFLINTCTDDTCGIQQYATGKKGDRGHEGTWKDAEDGVLQMNPIAQGAVDSCVGVTLHVPAGGARTLYYWIICGRTHREVRLLNQLVVDKTPETLLIRTRDYWKFWINIHRTDYGPLPPRLVDLYKRSILILRTNIDNNGAIIAANDSDVMAHARDTYSYLWPRDGAFVAYALDRVGYGDLVKRFFYFTSEIVREEGYFLHKYNPDGTVASSWHPWVRDGRAQLPIQEDETGLVLWALWDHFERYGHVEFIKPLYRPLIIRCANFMEEFRDRRTGLPLPSYDLWEERWGVLTFTSAAVWAGLRAAANFAASFGEHHQAERYLDACDAIKAGMDAHLWRSDLNRFARMIAPRDGGGYTVDPTIDASLFGVFQFGAYAADDPKVVATMQAVKDRLWVKTDVGGIARYEDDYYHQVSKDVANVPGNPWFICTLWWAQFLIARAKSEDDLKEALGVLEWVADRALPSGVLAEQVDPYTNAPLSVSPLTWSHSTFVMAVLDYLEKLQSLQLCAACGQSLGATQRRAALRSHTLWHPPLRAEE